MKSYKFKNVQNYIALLNKIIDYLGGPPAVEKILNTSRTNIYAWRSQKNFKNGHMIRKIPFHHAKLLAKKIPWITIEEIRPDLFD